MSRHMDEFIQHAKGAIVKAIVAGPIGLQIQSALGRVVELENLARIGDEESFRLVELAMASELFTQRRLPTTFTGGLTLSGRTVEPYTELDGLFTSRHFCVRSGGVQGCKLWDEVIGSENEVQIVDGPFDTLGECVTSCGADA